MRRPKGFTRFLGIARSYLQDGHALAPFVRAVQDYAKNKKQYIQEFKSSLQVLIRLLLDWSSGAYRGISTNTVIMIIAALLYFLSPIDTMPDFLGPIGFTDDAAVILFVFTTIKGEIERYREWSRNA
jgi:uncharacterized membrane protein YkvA (DUF1232 family)